MPPARPWRRWPPACPAGTNACSPRSTAHFPNHHPDPTEPHNLEALIHEVTTGGYELGIGFDGDGDRIGVVDGKGRIVFGDQILQILAADVLARHPGATIIADVKTSQTFFDEVARLGGKPLMWKTGHSLIKAKMAEVAAPLSGEMSGHIFYKDGFYGHDDALYVAVRLLDILARGTATMADLKDAMPVAYNTPEVRFDCPEERKFAAIAEVKANLAREGARGGRHRRRAGEDRRRLVAGTRVQHAGGAGGAGGSRLARGAGAAQGRGAAATRPGGDRRARGLLMAALSKCARKKLEPLVQVATR